MPNSSPLVAIVILNWNGWRDTLECISACRKLEWPNFRILPVDNHSSDGSVEMLRGACPDLEIIETGANLGFAGGGGAAPAAPSDTEELYYPVQHKSRKGK